MSQRYQIAPSKLMEIDDPYTAYCLDEASAFMISKIEDGEEMRFDPVYVHYESFADMYEGYEV